jgi:hypothetical protein
MIQASELTGALDRADIRRFFDCADERRVTPLIAANRTQLLFGEIEAPLTGADALGKRHERSREPLAMLCWLAQEVIRQAERRLPTDARETRQLRREISIADTVRESGIANRNRQRGLAAGRGGATPIPYLGSIPDSRFPNPIRIALRMEA